jgi:site-specific DNA-methyltransferase (adenine-specific)
MSGDMNQLFYGDNLDVLRRHVNDESVDLIYLDPPFNSNADYNAFFAEQDGSRAAAQIKAFEDTWRWDQAAAQTLRDFVTDTEVPERAKQAMLAFEKLLGHSNMLAYLAMMAPRLAELWRKLKPTGSLYLHCDPTASHYLKLLLDAIFGPECFQAEITWKRTSSHNDSKRRFGWVADTILAYSRSGRHTFNVQYVPYSQFYIDTFYVHSDPDGRKWRRGDMRSPHPRPNLIYSYTASNGRTYEPHPNGWVVTKEKMEQLDKAGRLHFPKKVDGRIQLKRYLDEQLGQPVGCVWDDISPIHALTAERLGYPTQKPVALLERIIQASSNEGDTVLDPFCGCGTTIAAAQKLNRKWIGIDITHLAIALIKTRLADSYGPGIAKTYTTIGEPTDASGALELAQSDPYQFQWWSLGLVGARPIEQKKGADRGIDGRLYFHDDAETAKTKQVIFSVKAGNTSVAHVRDLRGVLDREQADIGVLITMHASTGPMRTEAASAGFYVSPFNGKSYPKLQLRTVEELLEGKGVDLPPSGDFRTFKKAPKARKKGPETRSMFEDAEDD